MTTLPAVEDTKNGTIDGGLRTAAPARFDVVRAAALVFGAVFFLTGLAGFVLTGFSGFLATTGKTLVLFGVNPLHNVAHLVIGGLWLLSATRGSSARAATQVFGLVYLLLGVVGFFQVGSSANILALNTADNLLHIVVGVAALAIGFFAPGDHGTLEEDAA